MKRTDFCPACNTHKNKSKVFLKRNINADKIRKHTFSSRKKPEFLNYQLFKCNLCDLIFSINIPDLEKVDSSYRNSIFISSQDETDAADVYYNNLKNLINFKNYDSVLEIGSGSGSFIKKLNVKKKVGIEPSISSIENADPKIKNCLVNESFENTKIQKNSTDLVCCFMTMEHVYDPLLILKKAYQFLTNKGKIILITHDYDYFLNKILGKKSPIIDIEHLQLFSPKSIDYILKVSNFKNIKIFRFKNKYRIEYWLSLLPIPIIFKNFLIKIFRLIGLSNFKMGFNIGNMIIIADKND